MSLEQSRPDEILAEEQEQGTGAGNQVLSSIFSLNVKGACLPDLPKNLFLLFLLKAPEQLMAVCLFINLIEQSVVPDYNK